MLALFLFVCALIVALFVIVVLLVVADNHSEYPNIRLD